MTAAQRVRLCLVKKHHRQIIGLVVVASMVALIASCSSSEPPVSMTETEAQQIVDDIKRPDVIRVRFYSFDAIAIATGNPEMTCAEFAAKGDVIMLPDDIHPELARLINATNRSAQQWAINGCNYLDFGDIDLAPEEAQTALICEAKTVLGQQCFSFDD